jgi:hypothetical protein
MLAACWTMLSWTDEADKNTKKPFTELTTKYVPTYKEQHKKQWTFFVYMAADNDLDIFATRNIEQMKQIGSDDNINIIVHYHSHKKGDTKKSQRLLIKKNQIIRIGDDAPADSGSAETLTEGVHWAIDNFPSDHLAIVLWNHGSGDLNPFNRNSLNPSRLFFYNHKTQKIELDRSMNFSEFVQATEESNQRGVCFDESTGNYLNDQRLEKALKSIVSHRGKVIDVLLFDACLMAGIGTAHITHEYADYMGASQEVVLGPGYNYKLLLHHMANLQPNPRDLTELTALCYDATYNRITNDYTHSALDLAQYTPFNKNVNTVAKLLTKALKKQKNSSVRRLLRESRSRAHCTYFDEPTYIDLDNLYANLLHNLNTIELDSHDRTIKIQKKLRKALSEGLELRKKLIFSNVAGRNFRHAYGISIYFPDRIMHRSFPHTEFAKQNEWLTFLKEYLGTRNEHKEQSTQDHLH